MLRKILKIGKSDYAKKFARKCFFLVISSLVFFFTVNLTDSCCEHCVDITQCHSYGLSETTEHQGGGKGFIVVLCACVVFIGPTEERGNSRLSSKFSAHLQVRGNSSVWSRLDTLPSQATATLPQHLIQ